MIISFKQKFVFVALPKTAGHAVRESLRPYLAANDWEQCTLFEERYFPVSDLAKIGHGHITAEEIQPFLLPGQWDNFFSFAFVRNPYDRFVSFCTFFQQENSHMRDDYLGTMKSMIQDGQLRNHILMKPQHHFLCDRDGNIKVDFVGRYESLQSDFDLICTKLGIASRKLPVLNRSQRIRANDDMDNELREMLIEYYQKDFELFGYNIARPQEIESK